MEEKAPNPGILAYEDEHKGRLGHIPFSKYKKRIDPFQLSGPKLFNSLPKEVRNFKGDLNLFKEQLDTFLTNIPDEPKGIGLIPRATDIALSRPSNSLINQIKRAHNGGLLQSWKTSQCSQTHVDEPTL